MVINPYNKYEFVTAGYKNVSIWQINGKNLLRFRNQTFFLFSSFYFYLKQHTKITNLNIVKIINLN